MDELSQHLNSEQRSRFWSKVRRDEDGCWEWTDALSHQGSGYGSFWLACRGWRAHRVAYTIARGPIPDGLVIDHLCRNPPCVRPSHLEAVTHKENTLRGVGVSAANARKTRCVNGHLLGGENAFRGEDRECLTCHRDRSREGMRRYRARKKAQRA